MFKNKTWQSCSQIPHLHDTYQGKSEESGILQLLKWSSYLCHHLLFFFLFLFRSQSCLLVTHISISVGIRARLIRLLLHLPHPTAFLPSHWPSHMTVAPSETSALFPGEEGAQLPGFTDGHQQWPWEGWEALGCLGLLGRAEYTTWGRSGGCFGIPWPQWDKVARQAWEACCKGPATPHHRMLLVCFVRNFGWLVA